MHSAFPIATPEANHNLRQVVASYRRSSPYYALVAFGMGIFGVSAAHVLLGYGTRYHVMLGSLYIVFSAGLIVAGLSRLSKTYGVYRGNKKGHVEYLPIAILHHIRGLLDEHGLGKLEQELLTWIGATQPRFQQLQDGRSNWDAARYVSPPDSPADAANKLLPVLDTLIQQFKNERKKPTN